MARKIAIKRFGDKVENYRYDLAIRIPKSWHENNMYDQREDWLQISTLENCKEKFAEPNVIQQNYNQGILIVEGSHAIIIGNKIGTNFKANIGLGGANSGETCIK